MGIPDVETPVAGRDRPPRRHVDSPRRKVDFDICAEKGNGSAAVANRRNAAGDIEARTSNLEKARDLIVP